ncbi:MAG TPA: hypothetical protein VFG59_12235 [Anaeromyxobacter sp.]|nr:hypothetical protein [Anaeromyxobacter sp.]
MTLFDLLVLVGAAELVGIVAVLTALVWPRRAGPRLALGPALTDHGPAHAVPVRRVIGPAPAAPPGAPVPGG